MRRSEHHAVRNLRGARSRDYDRSALASHLLQRDRVEMVGAVVGVGDDDEIAFREVRELRAVPGVDVNRPATEINPHAGMRQG